MSKCACYVALLCLVGCGGSQHASSTSSGLHLTDTPWEKQWERCERGYSEACLEAAAWFQGDPRLWPEETGNRLVKPPTDQERTVQALRKACEKGERSACDWMMGRELAQWPHMTEPSERRLLRDCEKGDAISCVLAAEATKDVSAGRTAQLLDRGCRLKSAEACFQLGLLYQQGRGVPTSPRRARGLFERACGAPEFYGCLQLGRMMWRGEGGSRDRNGAARVLQQACQYDLTQPNYGFVRGWPQTCIDLETLTGKAP